MKRIFNVSLMTLLLSVSLTSYAQKGQWQLLKDKIITPWAEKVDPEAVLPEYPRPQLVRGNWQNLNGVWSYAIRPKNENEPAVYDGSILVPFAVESALSGVGKTVGKDSILWYKNVISIDKALKRQTDPVTFWCC